MPEINSVAGQLVGIPVGQVYTAGPGIKIDNVHKTVSVDETVLYDGNGSTTSSATLSESVSNFQYLDLYMRGSNVSQYPTVVRVAIYGTYTAAQVNWSLGNNDWYINCQKLSISGTSISVVAAHAMHSPFNSTSITHESNTDLITKTICKVVGVHRIAGGN